MSEPFAAIERIVNGWEQTLPYDADVVQARAELQKAEELLAAVRARQNVTANDANFGAVNKRVHDAIAACLPPQGDGKKRASMKHLIVCEAKLEQAKKHSHFTVCSYCGKISDCGTPDPEAKRKTAMDHILECEKRPENQLLDELLKCRHELNEIRFYAKHWPDCSAAEIACSCGLSQLLHKAQRLLDMPPQGTGSKERR